MTENAETLVTRLRLFYGASGEGEDCESCGSHGVSPHAEGCHALDCLRAADEIERFAAKAQHYMNIAMAQETTVARLTDEIAEAREACPCVRMQDFFDAPLLKCVEKTVSFGFFWQSQAEQAEARATAAETREMELRAQLAAHREPYVAAGLTPAAEGGVTG
jgi:hypothetical protein